MLYECIKLQFSGTASKGKKGGETGGEIEGSEKERMRKGETGGLYWGLRFPCLFTLRTRGRVDRHFRPLYF